MSDAPERIYLQHDPESTGEPFDKAHDVTWCQDRINKTDVEYVLSSTYDAETARADRAVAAYNDLAQIVEGLPKYESVKTYAGFTNDVKVYGLLLDDKEAAIEQYRELADALARLLAWRAR